MRAFFELHIEQGGTLDRAGVPIGIVEGIVAIHRYDVDVTGFANHAGTTPMDERQDALQAASMLVLAVRDYVAKNGFRSVILGLSGGIACYKSAELVRELTKAGATVQVVMTEAAEHFITAVTMQALSGRAVVTSQWDAREPNNMAHINLTREADAVLVAPASADLIAQLAHGAASELLPLLCLARPIERCPLLVAPAMNREMWAHPATQRNLQQIAADGATVFVSSHLLAEVEQICTHAAITTATTGGAHLPPAATILPSARRLRSTRLLQCGYQSTTPRCAKPSGTAPRTPGKSPPSPPTTDPYRSPSSPGSCARACGCGARRSTSITAKACAATCVRSPRR